MIWDIEQQLPWHVAFGLFELAMLLMLGGRWQRDHKVAVLPAVGLAAGAILHVVYGLYFAEEYPRIGPYPLPWHGLFVVLELAVIAFLAYQYWRNRKLTGNDLSWLLVVLAAHTYYTMQLAEDNPTFELEIRWYGVYFAIGLAGAARAFPLYFERWGYPRKHGEALTLWTPIGMLLGAHFIHLIFYETDSIINNPIRIFQLGSGLASHGGGLGAVIGMALFCRRVGVSPLKYVDPSMCAATWVIPWVRVGNFFNSEIVGRAWDGPWAIAFPRHDCPGYPETTNALGQVVQIPCEHPVFRHPSQVYEAILAFIMLGMAIYLQRFWRKRLRPGAIFFILLGYYFTTRFFIEYTKEYQTLAEDFPLTMGQCLSLPIVLLSLYMLLFSKSSNIRTPYVPEPEPADGPDLDGEADEEAPPTRKKKRSSKKASSEKASSKATSDTDGESSSGTIKSAPKARKKRKKK